MTDDRITNTFIEHKDFLQNIFQQHAAGPDRLIDPSRNECDFLLILNELVTPDQQGAMYRKVRSEFCKTEPENAITSNVSLPFSINSQFHQICFPQYFDRFFTA